MSSKNQPERAAGITPRGGLAKKDRSTHPVAPAASPALYEDERVVTFSTKLPEGLQKDFKAAAAARGVKMQDATAEAVRAWISAQ